MKMSKRETDIQSLTVPSYIFMEFIDLTMRYRKLKWPMKKKNHFNLHILYYPLGR